MRTEFYQGNIYFLFLIFYQPVKGYRWRWFRIFLACRSMLIIIFPKTVENWNLPGNYLFLFFNILSTSIWLSMTLIPNFFYYLQVNPKYKFPLSVENRIQQGYYFFTIYQYFINQKTVLGKAHNLFFGIRSIRNIIFLKPWEPNFTREIFFSYFKYFINQKMVIDNADSEFILLACQSKI